MSRTMPIAVATSLVAAAVLWSSTHAQQQGPAEQARPARVKVADELLQVIHELDTLRDALRNEEQQASKALMDAAARATENTLSPELKRLQDQLRDKHQAVDALSKSIERLRFVRSVAAK